MITIPPKSKTLTAGLLALFIAPLGPNIAAAEGSKPKGAMDAGYVKSLTPKSNQFWWPEQLDLSPLRDHDNRSSPLGSDFDYAKAFSELDLEAVKKDLDAVLTDSQDWWPADFGNYGPFFIRMAWHSAGTYRTLDGRGGADGGQMRFDPLNSWPDNGNLDKARRLLWPVKQKYGVNISWADLMILAGNVALENMGFDTYGFAGGRTDDWEPDLVYWGPEVEMLASDRHDKEDTLQKPLGATHMGLIYVNPEGPKGKPDPVGSAKNIRVAFARMAMDDEETVALIAGGHTFGKMHGAHKPEDCLGPEPAAAPLENQGFGWKNSCGKGHSEDTVTSGLEGAWTQAPTKWTNLYLQNLLNNKWVQTKSPGGATQWIPEDKALHESVPDAHVEGKGNPPVMTTADMALKFDPEYKKIAEAFLADPKKFQQAFAKAWFKLTHRDMGPRSRYLGEEVPEAAMLWQDPLPEQKSRPASERDVERLKKMVMDSDLTIPELVRTAWGSASTFRASDMRGGANGARIALAPQSRWAVNSPKELDKVLKTLKAIRKEYGEDKVSLADLIVIGGAAALEAAAEESGLRAEIPVETGRVDATQQQTDITSFALMMPTADAFRNYYDAEKAHRPALEMLIDKADQLKLTVPEMVVLIGGMRVLNANTDGSKHGVLTDKPGTLSNDFFVNLLDMSTQWTKSEEDGIYTGVDRETGKEKYTATDVDLVLGAHAELRAISEVYAFESSKKRMINDFLSAWIKVMRLDRFDL